jgi:hypothetical protein
MWLAHAYPRHEHIVSAELRTLAYVRGYVHTVRMLATTNNYGTLVAQTITTELNRQGKPIAAIATLLDISPSAAYRRMNGSTPLDLSELDKIATFLGIRIEEIFNAVTAKLEKRRHDRPNRTPLSETSNERETNAN